MNIKIEGFPIEADPDKKGEQPIFPISVDIIATDYGEPTVFIRVNNRRLHAVATVEVEFFQESNEVKVTLERAGIDSRKAKKEGQYISLIIPTE